MVRRYTARGRGAWLARAGFVVLGLLPGPVVRAEDQKWWPPFSITINPDPAGKPAGSCGHGVCLDHCADIPPGAIPAPPGTYISRWERIQKANADADDFVIYKHEWYMGASALGPYGSYHLNEIAKRLPRVPFMVVLQPEVDQRLNQVRRLAVVQQLLECNIADADARVVIAFPQAEGLYSEEAVRNFARMLSGRGGYGGGIGGQAFGVGAQGFSSGFGGTLGISSRGY